MKWFRKFERKFGKYAIPGLMNYIVVLYALGLALAWFAPGVYEAYLSLNAEAILHGQVWRVITFLINPPSTSIFFALLMLFLYFQIGRTLEQVWGSFRFNVYFFMGMIGNILAAFLIFWITGISYSLSSSYINLSLFLAYALTFPDMQFMLFFVIPIKAKYLAYADIVLYVFMIISAVLTQDWGTVIEIVMSLLNFGIFFFMTRNLAAISPKTMHKRVKFRKEMKEGKRQQGHHKCHVCGITDLDAPDMTFRYCSKCEGSYEYCSEHLYTHIHVTKADNMNMTS